MTKAQKLKVEQKDTSAEPIPLVVFAESVRDLAKAGKALQSSPLKHRAIVLLLNDMTGLPQRDINKVLSALPLLEKEYLK